MFEKYYTPSIEEFRVGFEVELLHPDNGIWGKYIIRFDDELSYLRELADQEELRVKYLDREDIESLGFCHIGGKLIRDIGQEFILYNGEYYIHLSYTKFSSWCSLRIEVSVNEDSIKTLVVHSIRIKNKSELIVLLNQLNMLNKNEIKSN
jgi:hypothetical protein